MPENHGNHICYSALINIRKLSLRKVCLNRFIPTYCVEPKTSVYMILLSFMLPKNPGNHIYFSFSTDQ